jgi:hypothetical protein
MKKCCALQQKCFVKTKGDGQCSYRLGTHPTSYAYGHGFGARLICQPDPRPCVKTGLSPPLFQQLSRSLFPLSFSCTAPSCLRLGGLHLSLHAPVPTERYDAASEGKCLSATSGSDSLDTPAALSRRPSTCGSTLENDDDGVPGFLGSPATWSRDGEMQDHRYPPSLLNKPVIPQSSRVRDLKPGYHECLEPLSFITRGTFLGYP